MTSRTRTSPYARRLCENSLSARAALIRKESRGGHFRDDFSSKADRFGKVNLVIRKAADGSMQVEEAPIPEMPAELMQIIEENK